jgi:hypothetical protein
MSKVSFFKVNSIAEPICIINKWFRSLSLQDKAMALTIVDKDLVGLFRAMYRCEQTSGFPGGNFTTLVSEALDLLD